MFYSLNESPRCVDQLSIERPHLRAVFPLNSAVFYILGGFSRFVNIFNTTGPILMFLYAIEAEFHPASNGDYLKSFTRGISTEFGVFIAFSAGFSHFCNILLSTKQTIDHTEML